MKWGWWIACALACSHPPPEDSSSEPPTIDAGPAALEILIGIKSPHPFSIVRGESVAIPFLVGGRDAKSAKSVGATALPQGVTADPVILDGATTGAVTLHAAFDAPLGDATCELVSSTVGSAKFSLTVVDVDGSLDPTFGTAGVLKVADLWYPVGIAAYDDTIVVAASAASANNSVAVARYLEDGTRDPSYGEAGLSTFAFPNTYGGGTDAIAFASCGDGSVVVISEDAQPPVGDGGATLEYHAIYFDQQGAVADTVLLPTAQWGTGAACVNGEVLLPVYEQLIVVDAAHQVHTSPLPNIYYAMHITASASETFVASSQLVALGSDFALDTSFGANGAVPLAHDAQSLALDATGRFVMGTGDHLGVARNDANGAVDATFGVNGVATLSVSAMPDAFTSGVVVGPSSGDLFVTAGSGSYQAFALARLDHDTGALVTTFGAHGITTTFTDEQEEQLGAAFDSHGRLWTIIYRTDGIALARYRIDAP